MTSVTELLLHTKIHNIM